LTALCNGYSPVAKLQQQSAATKAQSGGRECDYLRLPTRKRRSTRHSPPLCKQGFGARVPAQPVYAAVRTKTRRLLVRRPARQAANRPPASRSFDLRRRDQGRFASCGFASLTLDIRTADQEIGWSSGRPWEWSHFVIPTASSLTLTKGPARAVGKEGYVPPRVRQSLHLTELSPAVWCTSKW
jgi:hypothetical protein